MPRVRAAKPKAAPAPAAPVPAATSSMSVKKPPIRRAASAVPVLPPTPPATTHKRKRRSRSRVTDSSSEEEDADVPEPESDKEEDDNGRRIKKRKLATLDTIAEELSAARAEEEFWLGDEGGSSSTLVGPSSGQPKRRVIKNRASVRARSRTRSPSSSPPPAPHLLRRGHTGLISPPPSRRAPTIVPRPVTPPPTVHKTKATKEKAKGKGLPERDSPNNPFLADGSPGSVPVSEELSSPEPRTPKKHVEKPTVAVVFRGVKAVSMNPHYVDAATAAEIDARARLPTSHPEFEESAACPPKLLFPEARKHDLAARRRALTAAPVPTSPTPTSSKRARAGSASSEEGHAAAAHRPRPGPSTAAVEEVDLQAMSAAMAANIARRMRKGVLADGDAPRTRPSSRQGASPELPEKDRSDPIKRALGPRRD